MHPKARSHNFYLPARETWKPPRNLVLGLKKWIGQVRCENKTQVRKHKVVHFMHPKPDLTICTTRQRNREKPPRNNVLGLKKWIGYVCCEKTRRNFGSIKWCIVCTPKPRSHNGYLQATESRETTQKLSFGPKEVDWARS